MSPGASPPSPTHPAVEPFSETFRAFDAIATLLGIGALAFAFWNASQATVDFLGDSSWARPAIGALLLATVGAMCGARRVRTVRMVRWPWITRWLFRLSTVPVVFAVMVAGASVGAVKGDSKRVVNGALTALRLPTLPASHSTTRAQASKPRPHHTGSSVRSEGVGHASAPAKTSAAKVASTHGVRASAARSGCHCSSATTVDASDPVDSTDEDVIDESDDTADDTTDYGDTSADSSTSSSSSTSTSTTSSTVTNGSSSVVTNSDGSSSVTNGSSSVVTNADGSSSVTNGSSSVVTNADGSSTVSGPGGTVRTDANGNVTITR